MKRIIISLIGICLIGYLIIAYTWMIGDIKQVMQRQDRAAFEMLRGE